MDILEWLSDEIDRLEQLGFDREIVIKHFKNIKETKITTNETLRDDIIPWQKHELIHDSYYDIYTTYAAYGSASCECRKRGWVKDWKLLDTYFTVALQKPLIDVLTEMFPYLKDFDFEAYYPHSDTYYEIYIKTESGPFLYTPLEALKQNDFSKIEKRMRDYWSWFHKQNIEKRDKILKVLEGKEAAALRKIFNKFSHQKASSPG